MTNEYISILWRVMITHVIVRNNWRNEQNNLKLALKLSNYRFDYRNLIPRKAPVGNAVINFFSTKNIHFLTILFKVQGNFGVINNLFKGKYI